MRIPYLILIFLSIALYNPNYAQDSKSQKILNKLSTKIKNLKSFYIEFNATVKNNESGHNESSSGKGWVKGNKYYATYGDNAIICNGLKSWTIISADKEVYESDSDGDDDMINPKKLMTLWESGFKNKYEKEDKIGSESVHVISLHPKNLNKADYNSITVYISKSTNDLKKAIMKSKDGTVMTYSVSKFTSNPKISDTKFVFDKKNYPGYKVIKD